MKGEVYQNPAPQLPGHLNTKTQGEIEEFIISFLKTLARRTIKKTSAPAVVKEIECILGEYRNASDTLLTVVDKTTGKRIKSETEKMFEALRNVLLSIADDIDPLYGEHIRFYAAGAKSA